MANQSCSSTEDEEWRCLNEAIRGLEECRRSGAEPDLGRLLPRDESPFRRRTLVELIKIDQEHRYQAASPRLLETYLDAVAGTDGRYRLVGGTAGSRVHDPHGNRRDPDPRGTRDSFSGNRPTASTSVKLPRRWSGRAARRKPGPPRETTAVGRPNRSRRRSDIRSVRCLDGAPWAPFTGPTIPNSSAKWL